jgi:hypothetical protein
VKRKKVLCFTVVRAAHEFLKEEQTIEELISRMPQLKVSAYLSNMSEVWYGPLVVAMYGSTSTSDSSWLVFTRGKACYNPVYH